MFQEYGHFNGEIITFLLVIYASTDFFHAFLTVCKQLREKKNTNNYFFIFSEMHLVRYVEIWTLGVFVRPTRYIVVLGGKMAQLGCEVAYRICSLIFCQFVQLIWWGWQLLRFIVCQTFENQLQIKVAIMISFLKFDMIILK
eukprot:TRINITY_DN3143_c0_g1_i2.p5 TRINITY_DN3143_c0_g1~~TRINITY_DN3143_c0_g1_i2.p5  ORF type:complete len:142 (-),score=4.27 TRINITY_DN3143_c0_g1_i2:263-688(-)